MLVAMDIPPADIGAVELLTEIFPAFAESDHVSPDLEHVRRVGVVHHIRSETSRRTHIHFKAHIITFLSQSFPVPVELEKLKVYEAVPDTKGLDGAPAYRSQLGRHGLVGQIEGVKVAVDDVHYRGGKDGVVLKNRLHLVIEYSVV